MSEQRRALIELARAEAWRTYLGGALLGRLHGECGREDNHFPEEWIMSVVSARNEGREMYMDEGMSYLGEDENRTLKELLDTEPEMFLGKEHAAVYGAQPGVLIKLIDAAERLTIQVHPSRLKAMELFQMPFGKTECWYILGGREIQQEKPCIYIGFKEGVSRPYWKDLFEKQDISGMLNCLHRFEVKSGDIVLIEGGVPHAIGAGCLLAEIQEPTDYTIRVERTTPGGFAVADTMCHQGLGFERMFECFHFEGLTREEIKKRWFLSKRSVTASGEGQVNLLVGKPETSYFSMREITVSGSMRFENNTFCVLYVLEGKGVIQSNEMSLTLYKTRQIFIPFYTKDFKISAEPEMPLRILQCFGPN